MNNRYVVRVLGAVLLALCSVSPLAAQGIGASTSTIASAKAEAIGASGIMKNPSGGDDMVARAIYVKLRKGYGGSNPSSTVAALAPQAGLRVASATPIAYSTVPLDKGLAARIQGMPKERREQVRMAEDELSRIIEVHYASNMLPSDAARLIARLPEVEYAEPIYLPYALGNSSAPPNDPRLDQQFQLGQAKVLQAWDHWRGDTNMVIAVVDAGIDMFHEDLAGNIKENAGEVGTDAQGKDKRTNGRDDDNNSVIDDWRGANLTAADDGTAHGNTKGSSHGTEVAGLCAATPDNGIGIAGTGYYCRFFPIKASKIDGGPLIRAYEGIMYAARRNYKVINCSFGADTYSKTIEDILINLTKAYDCAIVAGAGNGVLYAPFFPAGYKPVMGVGAIDQDNSFRTTWGEQVDISSPGGYSTANDNNYYALGAATSYATPVVAGVLGLVRSKWPTLKADQALAHIRLTADPLTHEPEKTKLTGYGRLNALKAVTVDPFSHPAIMIDTVWMTDQNDVPQNRSAIGQIGKLHVRVRNILGGATNVRLRVVHYTSDSTTISVSNTTLTAASLATGEVKELEGGIPFQVRQPSSSQIRLRFEITADNGYNDYHYEHMLFYLPYITYHTPKIDVSLTDRGRLGFEDYPYNSIGEGLTYETSPFLYEGGFIVAKNSIQVLSNIRNGNGAGTESHFGAVEYPNSSNNHTLTLNDAPAADYRIGVELRIRIIAVDSVPDGIGIELRTKNISQSAIDSLRVAMFADWDLDNTDIGQSLTYIEAPKSNVPFYGQATGESGYYVMHGVAAPAPLPIFYAIRNDTLPMNLYDGFPPDKKWRTVSNGIGSRSAVGTDSSDISLVIGKRIVDLQPQEEDTTIFVIGISALPNVAIKAMRNLAPKLADTSTSGVELIASTGAALGAIRPNPFNSTTTITIGNAGRDAKLFLYDPLGRIVADLSSLLPGDGTSGEIIFDGSGLASGIYQLQLIGAERTESRTIVLTR